MKRVLVTGANGFIGGHCLSALVKRDFEVHAVSRTRQDDASSAVHFHQFDLLDRSQVLDLVSRVNATHLLHLAWYAVPAKYWSSEQNLRWVQASLDLFQGFAASGGRRIVSAGSCAEYEWGGNQPLSERVTALKPSTLYGTCKHALQIILETYASQANLSAAWGRIFFLYGPKEYEERLVASVIRALLRGEIARCSHGEQVRDFLYVEDVAESFVALLDSEVQGAINIGSGIPIKLRDVINEIGRQMDLPQLIQLNALPSPADEPAVLVANVERLTNELKWKPAYDLQEGIGKSIAWWRSNQMSASVL
jgi:nucleoside-diphosphate-sugar epimerase